MNLLIKNKLLGLVMSFTMLFTACGCSTLSFAKTEEIETIELNKRNTVAFGMDVSFYSLDLISSTIVAKRIFLPQTEKLYVVIGSYGGLYNVAKVMIAFLNAVPDLVLICNNCQSAAGLIFMTSVHPRLVKSSSILMMHEMYNPHATAKQMNDATFVKSFTESSDEFNKTVADTLKMPIADYEKKIINTSWTLKGQDIVKNNLADKVVKVKCTMYVQNIAPKTCGAEDESE